MEDRGLSIGRTANISLQYNGKQVSEKVSDYIETISYTDVATGESDSIAITLSNLDKKWITTWLPQKGDKLNAKIITKNWIKEGDKTTFHCGEFTIDDCSFSGRPLVATINGVSIPATEGFQSTERNKDYKRVKLKEIANEIAKRYKMKLVYDADDYTISMEQSQKSDSSFLQELCQKYGLCLKVYAKKIIIYDEGKYEKKKVVATIHEKDMESWDYNTTLVKTYNAATISYTATKSGSTIKIKVGNGKRVLNINETADSLQDAEIKAISSINNENKKANTMQIRIEGNPKLVASSCISITGLGKLNGKYFIEKVVHSLNNGYFMNLNLRKIGNRYALNSLKSKRIASNKMEYVEADSGFFEGASEEGEKNENQSGDYVVKRGDSIWSIAKSQLGDTTKTKELYEVNQQIIEQEARKRGKTNSEKGKWLYPGTKLVLPK